MTDLMISGVRAMPRGSAYHRNCLEEYRPPSSSRFSELKHSKSDDLVLHSSSSSASASASAKVSGDNVANGVVGCELGHSVSESGYRGSASRDDLLSAPVPVLLPRAECFSDCEPESDVRLQVLDTSRLRNKDLQRKSSHHVGIYDRVDPEDSIRDMISENDFYRFVLFKTHYDKYLHLSKKYEEARNIAYYLEEKYHEIKAERDGLASAREELQKRLEGRELELHDKEEELFLQLERVVRLEEDCEKLRAEKEKFAQWKDELEKEKQEAYRRLKQQSRESEATRRGLERARQDVVRQVSVIAAEKDSLERENENLKQQLNEERRGVSYYLCDLTEQKKRISQNVDGLEREVSELKLMARQSQSLNSQLKKGMKHLATCRRNKCHVCTYTRDAFGEYANRDDKKLFSCLQAPLQDWRNKRRGAVSTSPSPYCSDEGELYDDEDDEDVKTAPGPSRRRALGDPHSSPLPSCRSEYSFRRTYSSTAPSSPSPSHSLPLHCLGPHISYIDEVSNSSGDSGQGEDRCTGACNCLVPTDESLASACSAPPSARAFSSDSGFSSELYDTGLRQASRCSKQSSKQSCKLTSKQSSSAAPSAQSTLQRGTRWTSSFRKLLTRVSNKKNSSSATGPAN